MPWGAQDGAFMFKERGPLKTWNMDLLWSSQPSVLTAKARLIFKKRWLLFFFFPSPATLILSTIQGQRKLMQYRSGEVEATLLGFNSWAFIAFLATRQTSPKTPFLHEKQTTSAELSNRTLRVGLKIKEKRFWNLCSRSIVCNSKLAQIQRRV